MPRKKISKKEFVAGLPPEMPAAEVVAKGQRIGIELSQKQVSNIRSDLKMKAVAAAAGTSSGPKLRRARTTTSTATTTVRTKRSSAPPPTTSLAPPTTGRPVRTETTKVFVQATIRLGIDEARRLLDELEATPQ